MTSTLKPTSEADLAGIIASATGPLAIQGGGTRGIHVDGTPLSVAGLSGITLYEPGALTIVAQAGTPVAEIEATLAAENQMLAFEPMDHRALLGTTGEPTIGGVVAANISGPRRVQTGACRDFLLGVRFVDGEGTVIKNGGRVMKNVTGYDLARLICGAHGTLGVLSEVSLKVLPRPETQATLIFEDLPPNEAVPLMAAALKTPFDVTGAAFGPYHYKDARCACLRIEGTEASVKYRAEKLTGSLASFGTARIETDPARSADIWRKIRDVEALSDMPFVARASLKPGAAPQFIECVGQTIATTDYLDWGGGLVWMGASEDQLRANAAHFGLEDTNLMRASQELLGGLREYICSEPGHIRPIKMPGKPDAPVFQPEGPSMAQLAKGLRQKFDPKGILNPGLMG